MCDYNSPSNLLGRDSIATLGISVDFMMNKSLCNDMKETVHQVSNYVKHDMALQSACEQMCQNFPDVFKPELGCLKDFELDIRFKNDTRPIFFVSHDQYLLHCKTSWHKLIKLVSKKRSVEDDTV